MVETVRSHGDKGDPEELVSLLRLRLLSTKNVIDRVELLRRIQDLKAQVHRGEEQWASGTASTEEIFLSDNQEEKQ